MKKSLIVMMVLAVAVFAATMTTALERGGTERALVDEMYQLTSMQLASLDAIEIQPYTLPKAGVDVMRVRLEETYEVEGIGTDTVELTGWIAVRHDEAKPHKGSGKATWHNFEIGTQFIALELEGESEIFGPVRVTLDEERPAYGRVGTFGLPEKAQFLLASDTDSAECTAPVNVQVSMPQLGLSMKTENPAEWHSSVTTVPPVGHQASVTIEPVSLVDGERRLGTLVSGKISFREVVASTAAPSSLTKVASLSQQ